MQTVGCAFWGAAIVDVSAAVDLGHGIVAVLLFCCSRQYYDDSIFNPRNPQSSELPLFSLQSKYHYRRHTICSVDHATLLYALQHM